MWLAIPPLTFGTVPDQQVEVLFAEMEQNEGASVDSNGRAVLRFSCGVTAYLEWAVGVAYKMRLTSGLQKVLCLQIRYFLNQLVISRAILCVTLMEICY